MVEAIDKDTFAISATLPVMAVTTHVHWDHIGGHKYFENIAVHEAEKDWLSILPDIHRDIAVFMSRIGNICFLAT